MSIDKYDEAYELFAKDLGEIEVGIAADPKRRKVAISFGKEVKAVAMSPEEAIDFAARIIVKASQSSSRLSISDAVRKLSERVATLLS